MVAQHENWEMSYRTGCVVVYLLREHVFVFFFPDPGYVIVRIRDIRYVVRDIAGLNTCMPYRLALALLNVDYHCPLIVGPKRDVVTVVASFGTRCVQKW